MVTWMVNVTLWVMRFVHSRSKSHTNLIPTVFLPPLLVPLLQLYNWVVRIKVKAVLQPPDIFAAGVEDSGVPCLILFSGIRRGLTLQTTQKQSSVVHWIICLVYLLKCSHLWVFLCVHVFIVNSSPFSGWTQSDHGDKSVAETCKFMVHDCANGPWARAPSMDPAFCHTWFFGIRLTSWIIHGKELFKHIDPSSPFLKK